MASNDNPSEKDLKSTSQEFEQDVQPYSDHSIKERDDEADPVHDGELKRELTPSQITMIAIGGSIGTGLIIGTGSALRQGGPASLFLSYAIFGLDCFAVLQALGEMSAYIPSRKGFPGHATRFIDPAAGVAVGYNYLFKYLIVTPNQLNATAILISYWSNISSAVWVSIILVLIVILTNLGVRWFGHIEFWMSFGKIIVLVGLLLFALIIDLGGGPSGERLGFVHWKNGQAFREYKGTGPGARFAGFWSCMTLALFAYMGSELVAVCTGESSNPRKAMPSAIKSTFARIVVFYVFGSLLIGMVVNSRDPRLLAAASGKATANASPFVIAAINAGVKVLPSLINACLILFTVSAANSDLYVGSRTLYALAVDKKAPAIFKKCNRLGVPVPALIVCTLFCGLAYLGVSSGGAETFGYLTSTVTIFGGLTWIGILASHIRMMQGMKAQNLPRSILPYQSVFQPYSSWIAILFTSLVILTKGFPSLWNPFNYKSFITHYVGIPVVAAIYIGWKLTFKTKMVKLEEMELVEAAKRYDYLDVKVDDEEKTSGFKAKVKAQLENWKP